MFHILVAVIVISTGETGQFVSHHGFPSMAVCVQTLPAAEQQFRAMLLAENGYTEKDVRLQMRCEFIERKQGERDA